MTDSDSFWKLFKETGDVALYLLYREETAAELTPDDNGGRARGPAE